jgi:hypothetical protein
MQPGTNTSHEDVLLQSSTGCAEPQLATIYVLL